LLQTEILRDAADFVRMWDEVGRLRAVCGLKDDVTLCPLHFLATTNPARRSCSVACWRGPQLVGVMYATSQRVLGVDTGYAISGDYMGRGSLLCRREDEAEVTEACVSAMFAAGTHSLHIRHLPRSRGAALLEGYAVRCLDAEVPGDRMVLGTSYDEFLSRLGRHTRRNVRYYTRKAEEAGIAFAPELSKEEYAAGVERLNRAADFPAEAMRLRCDERLMALHGGGRRMGLRRPDGALVAVLCGFRRGDRFHLLTQLNDAGYRWLSLSPVLRGLAVEQLIATGHRELQFLGGTSLFFGRFCVPERYRSILVDRKRGLAAAGKRVCSWVIDSLGGPGAPIPVTLEMLCGVFLDERRLLRRTALGPAAVAYGRSGTEPPKLAASRAAVAAAAAEKSLRAV